MRKSKLDVFSRFYIKFAQNVLEYCIEGLEVFLTDGFFEFDPAKFQRPGMGLFTAKHVAWLLAGALVCVLMCLLYRRPDKSSRRKMELITAITVLFLETSRIIVEVWAGVFDLDYLPLHLCGMATYLTVIHGIRGGTLLGEFLYSTCMPGALAALLFPNWTYYPVFSFLSIEAFSVHILLVCYPIMLVAGGTIKPDYKRLPKCFLFLLSLAAPVYAFNKIFGTNFFFLSYPSAGSPLVFFESLLGNPGYILSYLPMLAAVWFLLYFPIEIYRKKKRLR